ncbi:MAG TPA: High-affnity carbon uptake protein Hat/HatR [Chryseosolibacter sp.]
MLKQPVSSGEYANAIPEVQVDIELRGGNPFPGLRPFTLDECHLFFGREGQADEILVKLAQNRFVAVMGYSGSGKSSLMYCGLVPVLFGGFMMQTGPHWNAVITRPGASPINNLTEAILEQSISSGRISKDDIEIHRAIIGSVLRSGPDGLIEVAKFLQSDTKQENIFVLVDQFEELFRYRDQATEDVYNESHQYINLLLTAIGQTKVPVYVALTMRSDFIGNCSIFPSLTDLINHSNYLVPQMTRDQKKMVIEGPVAVGGGKISQRLVKKLLHDIGNDQDQLPILQHVLMRTWEYWLENREPGEPLDIRHYNAVGRIHEALSQHANEAYDELNSKQKEIAEILFKNITEKSTENRGMRKTARVGLISELADAEEEDVIYVIDQFRQAGRSFLMPGANVVLNNDSMIELSHESLMRIWKRLHNWVDEEFESAQMYKRLSEAAAMYQIGKTGLWRPPDLQLALNWQKKQRPTREWAERYDETFERAIVFLDTSRITYEAELKNQEMMQRRVLRRTRATAVILGAAFVVAIVFFVLAYIQKMQADTQRELAVEQKKIAEEASNRALSNQKEALRQKGIAEQKSNDLLRANEQLGEALRQAEIERQRAENALQVAKIEEQKAIEAGKKESEARIEAQRQTGIAQTQYDRANQLYMRAIAQNLATKSVQEDDDQNLAGLLAMQGYHFHTRNEGKQYDPYIYSGLYTALTKINNNLAYNAIKAPGAPHVHVKSLAVSEKGTTFYSSGADGRILRGNYESLTTSATGFNTPYPIKTIALSKDEQYLVNGSDSSFLQVYSVAGGSSKPSVVVRGLKGAANDIEFMPDGSGFIVSMSDKTLSFVNHLNGNVRKLVTLPYEIKNLNISKDGSKLAGVTWSGQLVLIDLADNSRTVLVDDNTSRMLSVKFTPDGNSIAFGVDDKANKRGLIKMYDLKTQEIKQFTGHRAGVNDIEFSHDGKLMATAGADRRLLLWVLENPEALPIVMDNNNGFIWDIAFTPGSQYLIAACSESEIRVWPTDPKLMAEQICPKLKRNMTLDEWKKYVGDADIKYEPTCVGLLINDYGN